MSEYRDRVYIRKDIILKLIHHRELNQTALLSYCGLNLKKHKPILNEMESKELISKEEVFRGKKRIAIYKPTPKGVEFCKKILEPYEAIFPRLKNRKS